MLKELFSPEVFFFLEKIRDVYVTLVFVQFYDTFSVIESFWIESTFPVKFSSLQFRIQFRIITSQRLPKRLVHVGKYVDGKCPEVLN
jgi:hypothetical protein